MAKHKRMHSEPNGDGWTEWVWPVMDGYKMSCCDCGLVHDMQFGVLRKGKDRPDGTWEAEPLDGKKYRIEFRVRRNKRSTAQVRRHQSK